MMSGAGEKGRKGGTRWLALTVRKNYLLDAGVLLGSLQARES